MSTENNVDQLFEDSVKILTDLIAFNTVSGENNNSLINYCDEILKNLEQLLLKLLIMKKRELTYLQH